jgi:hypothetical protein
LVLQEKKVALIKRCDINTINQKSVDREETALDIAVDFSMIKPRVKMIQLLRSKGAKAKKANMD